MNQDKEVATREPLDPAASIREVEEAFVFNNNGPTHAQKAMCEHIESQARGLAAEIATMVPEGKHRTVAINNILGAVLWARQGILTQREVELVVNAPAPCCARDTNNDGNCDRHPSRK